MNLEQIQTFIRVYELGSFQEAAHQMYLPQPTVSHRINQMEKEFGKALLLRGKGKIQLTDEGRAFLPYAHQIISSLNEGLDVVSNLEKDKRGKLVIGCNNSFTNGFLPGLLDGYTVKYPKVALKIYTYPSKKLFQLVKSHQIDLAITRYTNNDNILSFRKIYSEPVVLMVSPLHRFAKQKKVTVEELLQEPLITYQKDTQYRNSIDITLSQHLHSYKPKYETNNPGLIKHFLKKNAGVHISSSLYMREEIAKKKLVPIEIESNPFPLSQIFLVHLKEKNALQQLFIEHIEGNIHDIL